MKRLSIRMLEDLRVRNYSPDTQKAYVDRVAKFVDHFGNKPPARLGPEHVRTYQVFLVEKKKCSWTMLNQTVCALRFFYGTTLGQDWTIRHIPYAKGEKKLPVVLSHGETERLLKAAGNMRDLSMILLGYSAGLRVSEIANLQVRDIDSDRMTIDVRRGKGRKDRTVPLSPVLLAVARQHWLETRAEKFLFPGANRQRPITVSIIQRMVRSTAKAAGIKKQVTPHSLRHTFATHHLEGGTDLRTLQLLLGHTSLTSTFIYLHVSRDKISAAKTPLELLTDMELERDD
jgi:site-specific recombinase XerD